MIDPNLVAKLLEKKGYKIVRNASLTGFSGINHRFDIVASKKVDDEEEKAVIDVQSGEREFDEEIISLGLKRFDVGVRKCFLVVDGGYKRRSWLKDLSRSLGVRLVDLRGLKSAL